MKASLNYNDYVGNATAAVNDPFDLNDFISKRGVDTERYKAIGASFFSSDTNTFIANIVCIDKEKSIGLKKFIVKIGFEKEFKMDEFFELFKYFEVLVYENNGEYAKFEIDAEIRI